MRTRAERRKNTWKKAKRQVLIEKHAEGVCGPDHKPFLKFVHAYSKSHVPYADPEAKTKNSYDVVDQKKIDSMNDQLDEQKNF